MSRETLLVVHARLLPKRCRGRAPDRREWLAPRIQIGRLEVNAVARTLRQHGIDATAIHNHGLMDMPRLFYMHFWGNDDPAKLAQGLKAALDQTNSRK